MSNNEIIVYYAFYNNLSVEKEQYDFFKLKNLRKHFFSLRDKTKKHRGIFMCPSFIERTKNIFYFNVPYDFVINTTNLDNAGIVGAKHIKLPFSLLLFSDTSLDVLFSSPYFHNVSHSNAFVPPTKININNWYRPFNVQYLTFDDNVVFLKEDPLVYLEFLTDYNIVFKEYILLPSFQQYIGNSAGLFSNSLKYVSLKNRYTIFNNSNFRNKIISLCKANLRKVS
jgi:hypothetical protein